MISASASSSRCELQAFVYGDFNFNISAPWYLASIDSVNLAMSSINKTCERLIHRRLQSAIEDLNSSAIVYRCNNNDVIEAPFQ